MVCQVILAWILDGKAFESCLAKTDTSKELHYKGTTQWRMVLNETHIQVGQTFFIIYHNPLITLLCYGPLFHFQWEPKIHLEHAIICLRDIEIQYTPVPHRDPLGGSYYIITHTPSWKTANKYTSIQYLPKKLQTSSQLRDVRFPWPIDVSPQRRGCSKVHTLAAIWACVYDIQTGAFCQHCFKDAL